MKTNHGTLIPTARELRRELRKKQIATHNKCSNGVVLRHDERGGIHSRDPAHGFIEAVMWSASEHCRQQLCARGEHIREDSTTRHGREQREYICPRSLARRRRRRRIIWRCVGPGALPSGTSG